MNGIIPENKKISPSLVFFLIHSMQAGIGVLGFQRIIAMSAGFDAWMSVIFTGLCIHIILWMMFYILETVNGDLVSIHTFILGKMVSKILCSLFILYFYLLAVTVLRNFVEIVQVWMFPQLETFWFSLVFLILVIYILYGGFRAITGIAFFSVVLPTYIIFLFLYTLPFTDFTNILPIFDHSINDLLKASRDMSLTVLGFETLLMYYPYLKEPIKSKKWVYFGNLFTTFANTYLAIITFAYFSENQLQKNIWLTLTMWKIIEMPFVERFEYIGIASWLLFILPNVCIALWCSSRLVKQIFSMRQKTAIPILALLCLIGTSMLTTREQINFLTDLIGKIGFYFNTLYIPILFAATFIAKKVKNI